MTAFDYPVDGNENPAAAEALYERARQGQGARLRHALRRPASAEAARLRRRPRHPARHPAVQGWLLRAARATTSCFFATPTATARRTRREVILTGFGVQDSHLFPHQFMRAPGDWIWMAQGAFNYGKGDDHRWRGDAVRPDAHGEVPPRWLGVRHHQPRPVQHLGPRAERRRRGVHPGGQRLRLSGDALPRIRELPRLLGSPVEELRAGIPRHRAGFQDGRHRPERPRALRCTRRMARRCMRT